VRHVAPRFVPLIAAMGHSECNNRGVRKVIRIADHQRSRLEEFAITTQPGSDFFLRRLVSNRYVGVIAAGVKFVADFEGINTQIGGFYGIEYGAQMLSKLGQIDLAEFPVTA